MSEISKEALAAACAEKVKQLEFSVKQSAFDSVRRELETELAIARVALLALRERAEPVALVLDSLCVAFVMHAKLAGLSDNDSVTLREAADVLLHCAEQLHNDGAALYTAPPAPVVPDAIPETESKDGNDIDYMEPSAIYELGKTHGWNACRAAMLGAALGKEG
ncbi:hypothetical protein SNQ63_001099 [Cronobacter sakazakii]|nr:hypothetical protein [Cronobacter sakazakii]